MALIGPNGAGKTTLFNLIAGALRPNAGTVSLASRLLTGLRPDQVCAAGVGRTFQIVKPFGDLSVEDNVLVGALHRRHRIAEARHQAHGVLDLLGLAPLAARPARSLTLPERKRRLQLTAPEGEASLGDLNRGHDFIENLVDLQAFEFGLRAHDHAMAQDRQGGRFHIVGNHEIALFQGGKTLGHRHQAHGRARTRADSK